MDTVGTADLPDQQTVIAAAERIRGHVVETPILVSDELNELAGADLYFKAETLQTTGSFKLRGATNRLLQIAKDDRTKGVVAFSSGNHAQGVARAARRLGMPATIVMPNTAPRAKIAGVEADGAMIRFYRPDHEDREAIAGELASETGAALVPSFDDPAIIAGQGSCGVELRRQLSERGVVPDHLICCAGGGGLSAGIALSLDGLDTQVWTAEPEGHDDWARSLSSGKVVRNAPGTRSICDAILTPEPGSLPWQILSARGARGLVVSDDDVLRSMHAAFSRLKLVVEPGGAVALAAALFHLPEEARGKPVCVILSGGNVDPDMFIRALETAV